MLIYFLWLFAERSHQVSLKNWYYHLEKCFIIRAINHRILMSVLRVVLGEVDSIAIAPLYVCRYFVGPKFFSWVFLGSNFFLLVFHGFVWWVYCGPKIFFSCVFRRSNFLFFFMGNFVIQRFLVDGCMRKRDRKQK